MQQDMHPIQGVFREVPTGGQVFRRSSNIVGEPNGVVEDGHATYLLGFSPIHPADGQYHTLTVKPIGHRDGTLRSQRVPIRQGTDFIERAFRADGVQPIDASDIGVSTKLISDAEGSALRVTVAGTDLDLKQQDTVWTGKLDIFLVQRDAEAMHARVSGLAAGLRLKPQTYQRALKQRLTFDERIDTKPINCSLRVVVVDVTTGRMGSVTVPSAAPEAKR
jgi:hypothetical protein